MKEQEKVFRELKKVTRELIRCGLAEEYNYPVIQQMDIVWEKYQNISLYLRNMDYSTIYDEIEKNHNYNVKLPDGGIIQLMYRFNRTGKELISHRLGYYPSPSYELYQNDPELYDVDYIYGDILNKSVLPVIIRADYNRDPEESELHHPYSHITLGGYKNCRIPVDRPISPMKFVKFIMEHFYYVPSSQLEFNFEIEGIVAFEEHIAEKDINTFYTSVNPSDYYNKQAKPIALKAYSAVGPSAMDDTYSGTRVITQAVKLPKELGEFMYNKYKEDKNYYKDASAFIKNVLKGIYVQSTHGDGTILYINNITLRLYYDLMLESSSGKKDSLSSRFYDFAATKEVIQANHFKNDNRLNDLVENPNRTYIKSPAGIFTEAIFPIAEIYSEHKNDTLNGVNVSFTRYNEEESKYPMNIPQYVLMVRKQDMFSFFEENKITDNKTSFLSQYSSSNNTYTFTNIAPLITYCIEERKREIIASGGNPNKEEDWKKWESENPDWNKVVLIPVKVESNSNNEVVAISNSLDMESAALKGGTNEKNKLKMQIFYTTF